MSDPGEATYQFPKIDIPRPGAAGLFSGPKTLPLAFGTWALGGSDWGPLSATTAKDTLRCAWEGGFRHFDTAESYGNGRSEQLIGQALQREIRHDRDSLRLATKSVVREPRDLEKHLERSLRRLGTSFIDLFYIHWPREGISLLRAVEELIRQKHLGRIGIAGLCNVNAAEYRQVTQHFPVDVVQVGYNILWRIPEEERVQFTESTLVAYSPLAQGLLARSFPESPSWDPADHRRKTPLFSPPVWETVHRFNRRYGEVCSHHGFAPAAAALIWLLRGGRMRAHAAVVGGRTREQIETLVRDLAEICTDSGMRRYVLLEREIEDLYSAAVPAIPEMPNIFGYVPKPLS